MAISGIGGSLPQTMTFRRINVEANQAGREATSDKMAEARMPVSNFGTEPVIGRGQFSQMSEQMASEAVQTMSTIMEQDDDYENPVNGEGTAFGPSGFQEANDSSFDPAMQRAASSYSYFNQ